MRWRLRLAAGLAVRTPTSQLSRLAPPGIGRTAVTSTAGPHSACSREVRTSASSVMTLT